MADFKRQSEAKDFKERFEFKLTVGDNIICQRYFKINNFNQLSESSVELASVMRYCASLIDNDLKGKTQVYLDVMAPRIFDTEEQMFKYFEDESHKKQISYGHGIVIRDEKAPNYAWGKGDKPVALEHKFDDGEFVKGLTDEDHVEYKLAFLDNGREVVATVWDGVYPKYVRNSIDLSNKKGKFEGDDILKLGFESYLLNMIVTGRTDLVYKIIKEICTVCSNQDNSYYTTSEKIGSSYYDFKAQKDK